MLILMRLLKAALKLILPFGAYLLALWKRPGLVRYLPSWISTNLRPAGTPLRDRQPLIVFEARDWLESFLSRDKVVFEYGSGGSTLFLAERAGKLISVEHDPAWHKAVCQLLQERGLDHCECRLEEPEACAGKAPEFRDPRSFASREYPNCTFQAYVNSIQSYPNHSFDLVLVDGRARPSCVLAAMPKLKPGGFLLLDDSGRPYYREACELLTNWIRKDFVGPTPYGRNWSQTSIWRKPDAAAAPSGSRLRVLFAVPGQKDASGMIFAHRQIAALEAAGIEAEVFQFSAGANLIRAIRQGWEMRKRLNTFRPHILHAQFGTLTAFVCSLMPKVPLAVTYRGSDLNPSPSDGWLRNAAQKLLSNLAARRADLILCVSEELKRRLWWGRERAEVLPTGVNLTTFSPMRQDAARVALGWTTEERVVLFHAGRTPPVKRLDLAEAALREARAAMGPVRFEVLWGGVDPSQIPLYLNASDCLLVTSDFEGSPSIVQEALACGLPVVSVEVGDVRERLEKVFPSKIVARDPRALGSALVWILRGRMRSNGRQRIQPLEEGKLAQRLVAAYRQIAGFDP